MKRKGQHFLLSAEARSFSLMQIFGLSDDDAFQLFKDARWPNGVPACPQCGSESLYWLGTRKQWRCKEKECKHTFSVTSGTIFANHKLPLRVYLGAIALYSNTAKGVSALQISRDLNVQYKTAFVLMHKLRESLIDDEPGQVCGLVEMDAGYVNKHVRPINRVEDRIDLRRRENQSNRKRALVVMRQRGMQGADKTLTFLAKTENQRDTRELARKHIAPGSTVFADEHRAYDALHADFETIRVNHKSIYVGPHGENTNQAESFFARFRRMQYGQHHRMDNTYMLRYANEIAYREDTRRTSNGEIFADVTRRCAAKGVSRDFCGYWQGNRKRNEELVT
jgi:transposase-like protein